MQQKMKAAKEGNQKLEQLYRQKEVQYHMLVYIVY